MSAAEAIAPEQSVDKVRQSLSVTDKGKTANTIDNCRIVFCCDPLLRDAIRLNLLTDRVDIVQDLGWRRNTSALTDTDVTNSGEGEGLVFYGSTIIPFKDKFDNSLMLYALMTSKPDEVEKRKKLGIGERDD